MTNVRTLTKNEARELNGGAVKTMNCRICGQSVTGGFWTRYYHCLVHSWKAVMPIAELIIACFGIAGLAG